MQRLPGVVLVPRESMVVLVCAPEGIRTPNLLIRSQMLYPLSYGRLVVLVKLGLAGRTIQLCSGGERI